MRRWLDWLFVGALVALCGVLGVLQYQWIGEVSVAAGERMKGALRGNLMRLSQDFNTEIATSVRALAPAGVIDAAAAESEFERRFEQVKNAQHGASLFRRVGFAVPDGDQIKLK